MAIHTVALERVRQPWISSRYHSSGNLAAVRPG